MRILGIESSCDDTAAAVVEDGKGVLSNVVSSQEHIHRRFGGVVPEVACRAHIEHVLPVVDRALEQAAIGLDALDAVAVTTTPGLIGALLIGVSAAKALSWALELPLVAVHHIEAHMYAAWLSGQPPALPAVSLVASGGHTSLYLTEGAISHTLLGRTVDDAAGEAFDKIAHILKLGYPGGPAIEKAAADGDPRAVDFPRTWLGPDSDDFSFSGLKTAVLYHCVGRNVSREAIERASYTPQFVADVSASCQQAVVDVLVRKTCDAAERNAALSVILGGGVAANSLLRAKLQRESQARGLLFYPAPRNLCTDNAVMIAAIGYHLLKAGRTAPLTVSASP